MVDFADFVVTSPDDRVQLVVETKRRTHADEQWAATLRRNLAAHGAIPATPYFLLALPDRFFLWRDAPPTEPVAPAYSIDARRELEPYMRSLSKPLEDLSGESFALVVQAWLDDLLLAGPEQANASEDRRRWLVDSGLWQSLRRGTLRAHAG